MGSVLQVGIRKRNFVDNSTKAKDAHTNELFYGENLTLQKEFDEFSIEVMSGDYSLNGEGVYSFVFLVALLFQSKISVHLCRHLKGDFREK